MLRCIVLVALIALITRLALQKLHEGDEGDEDDAAEQRVVFSLALVGVAATILSPHQWQGG